MQTRSLHHKSTNEVVRSERPHFMGGPPRTVHVAGSRCSLLSSGHICSLRTLARCILMAANNITVNTEGIDPVLKEANICLRELHHLHEVQGHVDTGMIEARVTLIFRNMMSSLYSVLDQVYYFLYCYYQNNGQTSFGAQAFQTNAPCKQNLKWSADVTTEKQQWSGTRKKWLDDWCNLIFGPANPQHMDWFRSNLLSLQAVREVNNAGQPVKNHGEISLMYFSDGEVHPLLSTKDMDDWRDVTWFNLLHFYRNFTTHRTLLQTVTDTGYSLNSSTFAPEHTLSAEQINNGEWFPVAKGHFIMVPELSHLRDKDRTDPPKFYMKPLLRVCSHLFSFVKTQRNNLVGKVIQDHDYPYEVHSTIQ